MFKGRKICYNDSDMIEFDKLKGDEPDGQRKIAHRPRGG